MSRLLARPFTYLNQPISHRLFSTSFVMQKTEASYGKWPSPITVDLLTGSSIAIAGFQAVGKNDLYFLESRPFESGRTVLVKKDHDGKESDVVSKDVNVRTKVHEYGGGGFIIDTSDKKRGLVYSHFKDSRLYYAKNLEQPHEVEAITPNDKPLRFADFAFHPTLPIIVAVCEDHTNDTPAEVENYLVVVDIYEHTVKSIVKSADFYSNPRFSPDGKKLIYKCWNHPEMPWTNSELCIADYDGRSDSISNVKKIAGGTKDHHSAVTQPRFTEDGTLLFVSDESGYKQLYKSSHPYTKYSPVTSPVKGDFADNDWQFGNSSFTIVEAKNEIIASYTSPKGLTLLASISITSGKLVELEHPFLTISGIGANPAFPDLLYITGSTKTSKGLFSFYASNGDLTVLKSTSNIEIDPAYLSLAKPLEIPIEINGNKRNTYGFYYPPTSKTHTGPDGKSPPLIMRIHGGPTSFSPPDTSLQISYWTSRGYAFFNLNYGGSSGFGREYMMALDSNWGVVDLEDSIAAAEYLAEKGYCDGSKMAIDGGSAGGYTVLNVLCHSQVFAAGCSYYGVSELKALAEDTHKFESQYLFNLVGGTPSEIPKVYRERSPLYHAANIKTPVMVQQGTDDKVVPINQAEEMVESIKKAGGTVELLVFKGEGHGFRGEKAQRSSLEGETKFYEKYLRL